MLVLSPKIYWFLLGHEPLVSLAELYAAIDLPLTLNPSVTFSPPFLQVTRELDPERVMARLGGAIKIGQELETAVNEPRLLEKIIEELKTVEGKINFGISFYDQESADRTGKQTIKCQEQIERWGKEIKKRLKEAGRSVRYVFKNETALSSVTVAKNGLDKRGREFLIRSDSTGFSLAKTVMVQPFEEFSARDFGRPGRDDTSGMLPPKLAMMLVNAAHVSNRATLLDPFCGSGTILTEAALLGFTQLFGGDISSKAVADTKKNIEWIQTQQPVTDNHLRADILTASALNLGERFAPASIEAIVTEPYLGPPLKGTEFREHMQMICAELRDLYIPAFQEFKKILKPGGVVIFTIPRFKIKNIWYTISPEVLPELEKIGFKKERLVPAQFNSDFYLLYHRPNQFVGREIWKFRLS